MKSAHNGGNGVPTRHFMESSKTTSVRNEFHFVESLATGIPVTLLPKYYRLQTRL